MGNAGFDSPSSTVAYSLVRMWLKRQYIACLIFARHGFNPQYHPSTTPVPVLVPPPHPDSGQSQEFFLDALCLGLTTGFS